MLKVKIIILLFPFLLMSCSWEYEYTYEIENTLGDTLVVKTSIHKDDCFLVNDTILKIAPNETKMLAHDTSNSASAKYHVPECEYEDEDIVVPLEVRFDVYFEGKLLTQELRKFKFWEFIAEKQHSVYRLKVTENMLNK
ncbi:hypothetical protein [Dysgonomonas sp. Marseille-P4361]|uniref:hypothetical protein n=1 Tax=Dysgonomonas sp. Marseille-P4361 TaxID=2161820 RepID=UPI000D55272A|nr:hypothetical protein [Dysgonomonas sp. Marseille-P4361]